MCQEECEAHDTETSKQCKIKPEHISTGNYMSGKAGSPLSVGMEPKGSPLHSHIISAHFFFVKWMSVK